MNLGTWYKPLTWGIRGQTKEEQAATAAQLQATYERQKAAGLLTPEEQAFYESQINIIKTNPTAEELVMPYFWEEVQKIPSQIIPPLSTGTDKLTKLLIAIGIVYGLIVFTPSLMATQRKLMKKRS